MTDPTLPGSSGLSLFLACLPGLERVLADEVRALGAEPLPRPGGVVCTGDLRFVLDANLRLGTASHVLIRIAEFPCRALGELERKTAKLPWQEWLRRDVPVEIRSAARRSRVYHTKAIDERMRNALVQAFPAPPPFASAEDPGECARLLVRFEDDVCTISLDTATTPLHRRGYRLETAKAPLREDIAHALLLASGWRPGIAFLDPFCGSGTIAIEAARLALGIPPGALRPPALRHTALWDEAIWNGIAKTGPATPGTRIAASDRDQGAVAAARGNATRAGVVDAIEFSACALAVQPWLADPAVAPKEGVLVTNPPFGLRVRGGDGMVPLFQTLGHRLGRLGAGWQLMVLARDPRLVRRTGIPLKAAFATDHGGIPVTALTSVGGESVPAEPEPRKAKGPARRRPGFRTRR